jgi:site-specific recombinase XerD
MARLVKGKAPNDFLFDFRGTTIEAKKNNVTEDMTAYLRGVAKITDEKKDGLHSLRHNWTNTALEHGIEWHVTQAVVGHSPSSGQAVTAGYGHLAMLDAPKRQAIETVVKALPAPVRKAITARFGK